MLNFSTNHAMIEQILVEHSFDLPLSQDDLLDVSCDEDDLHDDIYVIPMQSLKNDHAICVLKIDLLFIMLVKLMSRNCCLL